MKLALLPILLLCMTGMHCEDLIPAITWDKSTEVLLDEVKIQLDDGSTKTAKDLFIEFNTKAEVVNKEMPELIKDEGTKTALKALITTIEAIKGGLKTKLAVLKYGTDVHKKVDEFFYAFNEAPEIGSLETYNKILALIDVFGLFDIHLHCYETQTKLKSCAANF